MAPLCGTRWGQVFCRIALVVVDVDIRTSGFGPWVLASGFGNFNIRLLAKIESVECGKRCAHDVVVLKPSDIKKNMDYALNMTCNFSMCVYFIEHLYWNTCPCDFMYDKNPAPFKCVCDSVWYAP